MDEKGNEFYSKLPRLSLRKAEKSWGWGIWLPDYGIMDYMGIGTWEAGNL